MRYYAVPTSGYFMYQKIKENYLQYYGILYLAIFMCRLIICIFYKPGIEPAKRSKKENF